MKKLIVEKTEKTPYICFDNGYIEVRGRSILEDSTPFYSPLIEWLEDYIKKPELRTSITFGLEYSNSNSNKFIFKMIHLLEKCHTNGGNIKINWYFEKDDDSIKDLGNDLKKLLNVPIKLIEVNAI